MKKIIICALCAVLALTAAACGGKNKNSDVQNPSIGDIPTAAADRDKNDSEPGGDSTDRDDTSNEGAESGKSGENGTPAQNGSPKKADTSDRTPASDRAEIKANIRDAKELIDNGMTDDAKAIIRVLRSRELTSDEEKQVDELEAKLLKVSD